MGVMGESYGSEHACTGESLTQGVVLVMGNPRDPNEVFFWKIQPAHYDDLMLEVFS